MRFPVACAASSCFRLSEFPDGGCPLSADGAWPRFGRRETARDCPHPWRPACRQRRPAAPRPMLLPQRFHLLMLDSWNDAPVSRGSNQQPFLHRPVQDTVEPGVDARYGRAAETGGVSFAFPQPSKIQQDLWCRAVMYSPMRIAFYYDWPRASLPLIARMHRACGLRSAAQLMRGPSVIPGADISSKGGEAKVLRRTIRWFRFFSRRPVFFLCRC